jgi:hypothetical protein
MINARFWDGSGKSFFDQTQLVKINGKLTENLVISFNGSCFYSFSLYSNKSNNDFPISLIMSKNEMNV